MGAAAKHKRTGGTGYTKPPQRPCGDLGQPERKAETVLTLRPDVIVNAAAHIVVNTAESELDLARALNTPAPMALEQAAAEIGSWLERYSTDYVF